MPPEAQEQDMKAVDDKPYLHPGEGGGGGGREVWPPVGFLAAVF